MTKTFDPEIFKEFGNNYFKKLEELEIKYSTQKSSELIYCPKTKKVFYKTFDCFMFQFVNKKNKILKSKKKKINSNNKNTLKVLFFILKLFFQNNHIQKIKSFGNLNSLIVPERVSWMIVGLENQIIDFKKNYLKKF